MDQLSKETYLLTTQNVMQKLTQISIIYRLSFQLFPF